MNIEVKIVTHQGAWSGAVPDTPGLALAHDLPGGLRALLARDG